MLEKKILLEFLERGKDQDFLSNEQLARIFFVLASNEFGDPHSYPEEFIKVGDVFNPVDFKFNVHQIDYDSKINKVDYINFSSKALKEIEKYRIIDNGIYKKCSEKYKLKIFDDFEGEVVLAFKGEPFFKIKKEPNKEGETRWIYRTMTFEFYNKRGHLIYTPNLDIRPVQVGIALSVQNKKKEGVLVKMYDKVAHHYIEKGLKVLQK